MDQQRAGDIRWRLRGEPATPAPRNQPHTHRPAGYMRPSPRLPHLPTAGKSCQQQSTLIMGRISGRWGRVSPTGWVNPQSKNLCEPTTRKKPLVLGLQSPQRLRAGCLSNRKPTCSGEWPAGLHRRQQMAGQTATSRMREHGRLSQNPGVRRAHLLASSNIGEGARRKK